MNNVAPNFKKELKSCKVVINRFVSEKSVTESEETDNLSSLLFEPTLTKSLTYVEETDDLPSHSFGPTLTESTTGVEETDDLPCLLFEPTWTESTTGVEETEDLPCLLFGSTSLTHFSRPRQHKSIGDLFQENVSLTSNIKEDQLREQECKKHLESIIINTIPSDMPKVDESPLPNKESNMRLYCKFETLIFFNSQDVTLKQCGCGTCGQLTEFEKFLVDTNPVELENALSSVLLVEDFSHLITDCKSFVSYLCKLMSVHRNEECVITAENIIRRILHESTSIDQISFTSAEIFMLLFNYGVDCNKSYVLQKLPELKIELSNTKCTTQPHTWNQIPDNWTYNLKALIDVLIDLIHCCTFSQEEILNYFFFMLWIVTDCCSLNLAIHSSIINCIKVILQSFPEKSLPKIFSSVCNFVIEYEHKSLIMKMINAIPTTIESGKHLQQYISFNMLKRLTAESVDTEETSTLEDFSISRLESFIVAACTEMDRNFLDVAVACIHICLSVPEFSSREECKHFCSVLKDCENVIGKESWKYCKPVSRLLMMNLKIVNMLPEENKIAKVSKEVGFETGIKIEPQSEFSVFPDQSDWSYISKNEVYSEELLPSSVIIKKELDISSDDLFPAVLDTPNFECISESITSEGTKLSSESSKRKCSIDENLMHNTKRRKDGCKNGDMEVKQLITSGVAICENNLIGGTLESVQNECMKGTNFGYSCNNEVLYPTRDDYSIIIKQTSDNFNEISAKEAENCPVIHQHDKNSISDFFVSEYGASDVSMVNISTSSVNGELQTNVVPNLAASPTANLLQTTELDATSFNSVQKNNLEKASVNFNSYSIKDSDKIVNLKRYPPESDSYSIHSVQINSSEDIEYSSELFPICSKNVLSSGKSDSCENVEQNDFPQVVPHNSFQSMENSCKDNAMVSFLKFGDSSVDRPNYENGSCNILLESVKDSSKDGESSISPSPMISLPNLVNSSVTRSNVETSCGDIFSSDDSDIEVIANHVKKNTDDCIVVYVKPHVEEITID